MHMALHGMAHGMALHCMALHGTAKPSVENKSGLLNNMACSLSHHLIKAESPNLQLTSGSWPTASGPMQRSVCYVYMGNMALLMGDSPHKLYCSEVHYLNQQQLEFGPPVMA